MGYIKKTKELLAVFAVFAAIFAVSTVLPGTAAQAVEEEEELRLPTVVVTGNAADAYRYGGSPRLQRFSERGNLRSRDILDVNAGIDAGAVLGCQGLDIGGMIQNTFNVGDLGAEFQNYLQTMVAKEALTLLYSSPEVNKVLDGLKAIGHARVSMLQESCNANEIMANATNQRLRGEAQELCLEENNGDITRCEGPSLQGYVDRLSESARWSGTLHEHVCNGEDDPVCRFLPDFSYDINGGEGNSAEAQITGDDLEAIAEAEAEAVFEERVEATCDMVDDVGPTAARRALAEGVCQDGAGESCSAALEEIAAQSGPDACVSEDQNFQNVTAVLQNGEAVESGAVDEIIKGVTKCQLASEVHPHVDVGICAMPEASRQGAIKAISQNIGTSSSIKVLDALAFILSQKVIEVCQSEASDPDNTANPQTCDFMRLQIEMFAAQAEALERDQRSTRALAQSITAMVEEEERKREELTGSLKAGASHSGASLPSFNSLYSDSFR